MQADLSMKRLIVLGTGEAVCQRRHNTSFVLDNSEQYFLVDGGGGHDILTSIHEMGIAWSRLKFAFLSHEHTDHLLGMVWVVRYVAELINWNRYEGGFTLYTHQAAAEKLLTVCHLLLKPAQSVLIGKRIHVELISDAQRLTILGNRFTFFAIHSTKAPQFGFRMETPAGLSLVFLGDEPFSEYSRTYMEPCDWLLSEAFCLDSEQEYYNPHQLHHSTVRESCEMAERFHAKNLVLWHTEDETTYECRRERYTAEGKQYYSGNLVVPEDFDIIKLTAEEQI